MLPKPNKNASYLPSVDCVCEHCGTTFREKQSRIRDGKGRYCSRVCHYASVRASTTWLTQTCEYCGAPIVLRESRLKHTRGRFCSRRCRANSRTERRWGTLLVRFWSNVEQRGPDDCWPWVGSTDGHGYGVTSLSSRPMKASRLAYMLTKGQIPPGHVVRHSCDNPPCVNPAHLSTGTSADNSRDMRERHRQILGERNHHALLTDDAVWIIRVTVKAQTSTQAELAIRYGVTVSCINAVVRGRSWQHVPMP